MTSSIPLGANIIFIDGTCVFCNRLASFILAHDPHARFLFAHLQGPLARDVLGRHGRNAGDIDSVYVLAAAGTPDERLFWNGRAARFIWPRLFWFAVILKWVPLSILDFGYRAFAKRRYRIFGHYDVCRAPTPQDRARFIDLGEGA
jgi:predicted DCC family thiol-disulfide oxidoreductase YuxK